VLGDGAQIIGSSSMGAVRAAECRHAGMRGVGVVYRLFSSGILDSDDEVAVGTDPEDGHRAVTVALVNVRYAVRRAGRAGVITRSQARGIEAAAQSLFYLDRRWPAILRTAGVDRELAGPLGAIDVKYEDARRAVEAFRALPDRPSSRARAGAEFGPAPRYRGHDRFLGRSGGELAPQLLAWLFGSGRYQRYVWPLVIGEAEFAPPASTAAHVGPAELRERLAVALARLLGDREALAERLWSELDYIDELDAELMRWHAHHKLGATRPEAPAAAALRRVREEVAITHGYADWASLVCDVQDGRVFGAIPMDWVTRACALMAAARPA
jgi:hypothetical protein